MWTITLEFVPFLGLLEYLVAFLLAFTGTEWWKAAIIEPFINLILGFAASLLTDPGAAALLFLFSGLALAIIFPISFIVNTIFAEIGAFAWKWRKG